MCPGWRGLRKWAPGIIRHAGSRQSRPGPPHGWEHPTLRLICTTANTGRTCQSTRRPSLARSQEGGTADTPSRSGRQWRSHDSSPSCYSRGKTTVFHPQIGRTLLQGSPIAEKHRFLGTNAKIQNSSRSFHNLAVFANNTIHL